MKIYNQTKKLLSLGLSSLILCAMMWACSDDKNEPSDSPAGDESGDVTAFDELKWFEDNLVLTDEGGNVLEYIYGRVLDPAAPQTLFVGVDSEDEAAEIFKGWLAPDSESRLTESSDGSMVYSPKDTDGKAQGEIRYNVNGKGEDAISIVSFSTDAKLKHINEIRFIHNDLWPDNEEVINPYSVGEIVDFDTDYNYSNHKWDGWQKAVCVREASKNQSGYLVYISNSRYGIKNYDCPELPSPAVAKEVSGIMKKNWNFFVKAYKEAGYTLSDTEYYWINKRRVFPVAGYGIRLKDSDIDYFDGVFHDPKKPVIMVRTFGTVSI